MTAGVAHRAAKNREEIEESRAQFIEQLNARLDRVCGLLAELRDAADKGPLREDLARRLHALGAAAKALELDRAASAFSHAERLLGAAGPAVTDELLWQIELTLNRVPALLLGGVLKREDTARPPAVHAQAAELLIVALAEDGLEKGVRRGFAEIQIQLHASGEASQVAQWCAELNPDAVVIDADLTGAKEVVEQLRAMDTTSRSLVVGSFARPDIAAGWIALGADRVMPKPASPQGLKRALDELRTLNGPMSRHVEAFGDLTVRQLADRVADEIRAGLLDATNEDQAGLYVPFGDGADAMATVWATVANLRALTTLRSGGTVTFDASGPEGAIVLAPCVYDDDGFGGKTSRGGRDVTLKGRSIVVVDDDPAIVWFMADILREAGANVLEAADGQQGFELCCEHWPDLVISDVLMPRLDGFGLCRRIKQDIALSDVPVVLLSWKEDLLQRVRELGADADGYLRKEAAAAAITRRICEVLTSRASIERRLSSASEIHGRLEGLTPRLILQLVVERRTDARVTMRDAAYLYEVEVRGGRVVSAARTAHDGHCETGLDVLHALIGVRAARFSVLHTSAPVTVEFDQDLKSLLEPANRRARELAAILHGEQIRAVQRIDVDLDGMHPYLQASPVATRMAVSALAEGAAPAQLLADLELDQLQAVLLDLVRHNAIRAVSGDAGQSLLAEASSTPSSSAQAESPPSPMRESEPATNGAESPSLDPALLDGAAVGAPSPQSSAPAPVTPPGWSLNLQDPDEPDFESWSASTDEEGRLDRTPEPVLTPGFTGTFAPIEESLGASEVRSEDVGTGESSQASALPEAMAVRSVTEPALEFASASPSPVPVSLDAQTADPGLPLAIKRIDFQRVRAEAEAQADDKTGTKGKARDWLRLPAVTLDKQRALAMTQRLRRAAAPIGLMAGAGLVAFFGSQQLYGSLAGHDSTSAGAATPAAAEQAQPASPAAPAGDQAKAAPAQSPSAKSPPVAAVAPADEAPKAAEGGGFEQKTLELPEGVRAPEGKGLLEIQTTPGHKIYVGGVFIGRGPLRRVPIAPGQHDVSVRFDGRREQTSAAVAAGKRTLVSYVGK